MTSAYISKFVPSTDGVHTLAGRVYLPEGQPKGLFHVVHGMTEHIPRYHDFMQEMAQAGYICFGYDHLGHGATARDDGELGFIAHRKGWQYLVDDVAAFASAVRSEYGEDLPYILMGHSMGSFIVRLAVTMGQKPHKLIVMGTGGPNPVAGAGLCVVALLKLFCGEKHISNLLQSMAFGSYNKGFESDGPHGWLTTNAAVRDAYAQDKYCTFRFTVSAMGDLITLTKKCNEGKWFGQVDTHLPILLVSGSDDPVGGYGKGVETVCTRLQKKGVNVNMRLYQGRHEILNDTCRHTVVTDILSFIHQ